MKRGKKTSRRAKNRENTAQLTALVATTLARRAAHFYALGSFDLMDTRDYGKNSDDTRGL